MTVTWMKTGKDSANLAKKNEEEAQRRKEEQGKMWRFMLKEGEEARITFVDGNLDAEGFLLPPRWYEHSLYMNGRWGNNFVCPEKTNPEAKDKCPICESSDRAYLCAGFTIIDHRVVTKDGKEYKDRPKLLVAKPGSFEVLAKFAAKLQGLAGQTFDVSRSKGDKSPGIGDIWIPIENNSVESLQVKYTREVTDAKSGQKSKVSIFVPANYESEIVYRDGNALRALGLGASGVTPMSQPSMQQPELPKTDYGSEM